jgi:hypothetical protein
MYRYYLVFSPKAKCAEEDALEFSAKNAVDDEVHFSTKKITTILSFTEYQNPNSYF